MLLSLIQSSTWLYVLCAHSLTATPDVFESLCVASGTSSTSNARAHSAAVLHRVHDAPGSPRQTSASSPPGGQASTAAASADGAAAGVNIAPIDDNPSNKSRMSAVTFCECLDKAGKCLLKTFLRLHLKNPLP